MLFNVGNVLLAAMLAVGSVNAAGSAAAYNCGNCKCNDIGRYHIDDFTGASGCRPLDSSIRAMGLTGEARGSKTTCAVYSDGNCGNQFQSIGVGSGQTWGCTAFNQDAGSIQCWFDA